MPANNSESMTGALADFVVGMRGQRLDDALVAAARRCLTDGLGVAVAGLCEPPSSVFRGMRDVPAKDSLAAATQLGCSTPVDPWTAALVNGTLIHSLDFDDGYPQGAIHPGAGIIPVALAMAESLGVSDDDIVRAIVVGYEVSLRLAEATIDALVPNGFHPTSLCGTVGAAAVASYLQGLTSFQTKSALSLSTSFAGGLMQGHLDGSTVKKVHGGWAAQAGMRAAWFAARGFTGPHLALEGPYGLLPTHAGTRAFDRDYVTSNLGVDWLIQRISLKPYPCCHLLHAPIEAVQHLKGQYSSPSEIQKIEVLCPQMSMDFVVNPLGEKRRPSTPYGAKFSLPFAIAAAAIDDVITHATFKIERLNDSTFRDLIDKVDCRLDSHTQYPPILDAEVRIHLTNGRRLVTRRTGSLGTEQHPLTTTQLIDKFVGNCSYASLSPHTATIIAKKLLSADNIIQNLQALNSETTRAYWATKASEIARAGGESY